MGQPSSEDTGQVLILQGLLPVLTGGSVTNLVAVITESFFFSGVIRSYGLQMKYHAGTLRNMFFLLDNDITKIKAPTVSVYIKKNGIHPLYSRIALNIQGSQVSECRRHHSFSQVALLLFRLLFTCKIRCLSYDVFI